MALKKNQQAVVQIGLYKSCEYTYLVDQRYDHKWDIPLRLSEFENEKNWHYYGVDMNPESVEHLRNFNVFKGDTRINFIQALVHAEDKKKITHDKFTIHINGKIKTRSISLNTLFSKIPMPIGLLVMDVEGAELEILKGYHWEEKPKYIVVEVHRIKDISSISELLHVQRYRLAEIRQTNRQVQCGYIHRDYWTKRRYLPYE